MWTSWCNQRKHLIWPFVSGIIKHILCDDRDRTAPWLTQLYFVGDVKGFKDCWMLDGWTNILKKVFKKNVIFCYISDTSQKSYIPMKRFGALKSIIDFI